MHQLIGEYPSLYYLFAIDVVPLPAVQSEVTRLRSEINALAIENTLSAARYTQLISDLIAIDHKAEQQLAHLALSRRLATLNKLIETKGKKVLAEGAQGSMLDIDFGTFPFVTSSNTISAGVCTGLGVSPKQIGEVFGISKAYCTRVGSGPFPTELHDEKGEELRKIGSEFGATTGRPRRCGWIDLVALKYTCMINGVTQIIMTKADILDSFKELELGIAYEMEGKQIDYVPFQLVGTPVTPIWKKMAGWDVDTTKMKKDTELPATMLTYIDFINKYLGVPVKYVSNGPGRDQIVHL